MRAPRIALEQGDGTGRRRRLSPMAHPTTEPPRPPADALRRLVNLRWLAIAGQAAAVAAAALLLGPGLPVGQLAGLLALSAAFNALTLWRARRIAQPGAGEVLAQLAFDILLLAGLLYFAGGATNPFTMLFLVPVALSATLLPERATWTLAGLASALYALLLGWHVPLPGMAGHGDQAFGLHVLGMWAGFVATAALIAWFATRLGRSLPRRERELAAAREQALRDERLLAVATLAAGTAHELGTPLNTAALLAAELEEACADDAERAALARELRAQLGRCKATLADLSAAAGEAPLAGGRAEPVDGWLRELVAAWSRRRHAPPPPLALEGPRPAPRLLADRTLAQAIGSVLDNAADASPGEVEVAATWDEAAVRIEVRDRGPGLQGEARARAGREPWSGKPGGLGLGLFLAHRVVERFGGTVRLEDRPGGGLVTRIRLPLDAFQEARHEHEHEHARARARDRDHAPAAAAPGGR